MGRNRQILLLFGLLAAMSGAALVLIALQTALIPGGEILRLLISAGLGAVVGGLLSLALSRQTSARFFRSLRRLRRLSRTRQEAAAQQLHAATRSLQAEIRLDRKRRERTNALLRALDHDLDLAVRAQQALLRCEPELAHCKAAVIYQPYAAVSGDVYQVWSTRGECAVFLGDAMGHGVSAALITSILQTTLYENEANADGAALLGLLDAVLRRLDVDGYATAVLGHLSAQGEFRWSCAGWPPLMHLASADGEVHELRERGFPLGMGLRTEHYATHRRQLSPGDRLLLFSDGLLEWRSNTPARLETTAISAAMRSHPAQPLTVWLNGVFGSIQGDSGDSPRRDDITAIAIEYQGPSAS